MRLPVLSFSVKAASFCLLAAGLSACGSGGRSNRFESMTGSLAAASVSAGVTTLQGVGLESSLEYSTRRGRVTSITPAQSVPLSATITLDAEGKGRELTIAAAQTKHTWNGATGAMRNEGPMIIATSHDGQSVAAAVRQGEDQMFGQWLLVSSKAGDRALVGSFSVGTETPAGRLPRSGAARFKGFVQANTLTVVAGSYMVADLEVEVDHAARTARLRTTASQQASSLRPEFDLTGLLTAAPGGGVFTGEIRTAEGETGRAELRFYGAEGRQVGGVFSIQTPHLEAFFGSFAAAEAAEGAPAPVAALRP